MAKTRGKREGSIFCRADGRWAGQIDLGWQNGRRVRRYLYGATRAEVAEELHKLLADQSVGLPIETSRQTVGQFLTDWLEHSVKPAVRSRTYTSYEQVCRTYLIPDLGRVPLRKLAPQHVRAMLNRLLAEGHLSARSVGYIRVVLRAALNHARKWNLVARNAAELTESPRVRRFEIKPLTLERARALLAQAKGDRLEALYAVALASGLRMGETLGLRWQEDIDLDKGRMTINQAIQRQTGAGLVAVEPKTERSRRTIELPAPLIAALKAHRVRQIETRLAAGSLWQDSGLVFTSAVGTPLEPRNLHRSFKAMLVKAGLPDIRFHDLRHSAASLMLAQGVELRTIQQILGHSSISLTANTYAHVMPSLVQDATAKAAAALFAS